MAETLGTVGMVDRMMLLRSVPILQSLLPEDLGALAETATERTYEDDELVFRAGAAGDEMLVIVEGSVEAGPRGGPVMQRLERGDHVGELSVLRGAKRSTDVTARGATRVLAISASALDRLMEDRPEIARLMLANLAERLGRQIENAMADIE